MHCSIVLALRITLLMWEKQEQRNSKIEIIWLRPFQPGNVNAKLLIVGLAPAPHGGR